jgi:hypothetical protein
MSSRLITISARTADVIRTFGDQSFNHLEPNGAGFLIEVEESLFEWCYKRRRWEIPWMTCFIDCSLARRTVAFHEFSK